MGGAALCVIVKMEKVIEIALYFIELLFTWTAIEKSVAVVLPRGEEDANESKEAVRISRLS